MASFEEQVTELEQHWAQNSRWAGVERDYSAADVIRLRGSVMPDSTLAHLGAAKLWERLHSMDYVHA
ncbi:MAG: isocitrate lyase, partial [Acidimicrobiia bacterium]|nr:isocitrate lyase [Acidimicrobiia bacterium]